MEKRFNLYYLLFEDQRKNQMEKDVNDRIRKILNHFLLKKQQKPPLQTDNKELN